MAFDPGNYSSTNLISGGHGTVFRKKKTKINYVIDDKMPARSAGLLQTQQFGQQLGGKGGAMGFQSLPDFSSVDAGGKFGIGGGQSAEMDPMQSSIAQRRKRLAGMQTGDPNQTMKGF